MPRAENQSQCPRQKKSQSAAERRKIRVFISSTFRDIQEEHEELFEQVFPHSRRLCEEHGARF